MDSIGITNIKAEKANAIKKHRKIANFFRLVEVFVVLFLISRFTVQLPIAFKNSGEYFKDLSMALVSPGSVFVIGNVIVIILFAKSGQFSKSKTDIYQEFLEKSERSQRVYIHENRGKQNTPEEQSSVIVDTRNGLEPKLYRRSQSEKSKRVDRDKSPKELRRTLTEKRNDLVKKSYPEDNMSSEEFRQTIEAFIARQQKFIREEECSVLF